METKILERLLLKYPQFRWDWKGLSVNPSISLRFIEDNLHLPWSLPQEGPGDLPRKLELFWDWESISCRSDLSVDFFLRHSRKEWDFRNLTIRLPPSFILENPQFPWDLKGLYLNNLLTEDFYLQHHSHFPFDPSDLVYNSNFSFDFFSSNFDEKRWIENFFSSSPNVTVQLIEKYKDELWMERALRENDFLPNDVYDRYPYLVYGEERERRIATRNAILYVDKGEVEPNFPLEDLNWSWDISYLRGLSQKFIQKHWDQRWNWDGLSSNSLIQSHPEWPWEWVGLSSNPNLTFDFIGEHKDQIFFEVLSRTDFDYYEKESSARKIYRFFNE